MADHCFCGCGRRVLFLARRVNRRAVEVRGHLDHVKELVAHGMRSPAAEEFVREGDALCAELAAGLHGDGKFGTCDAVTLVEFADRARAGFSEQAFSGAILRSGLPLDGAAAALQSGEWDPFAPVEQDEAVGSAPA